jgi:hypothetical protein
VEGVAGADASIDSTCLGLSFRAPILKPMRRLNQSPRQIRLQGIWAEPSKDIKRNGLSQWATLPMQDGLKAILAL